MSYGLGSIYPSAEVQRFSLVCGNNPLNDVSAGAKDMESDFAPATVFSYSLTLLILGSYAGNGRDCGRHRLCFLVNISRWNPRASTDYGGKEQR